MQKYDFGKVDKILIITMNWVGDVLFTTPCLHGIRQKFPKATINVLGVPWVHDILEDNNDIDNGICTSTDNHAHGTTVSGTGSGNANENGRYKGAAPESDIIIVETR